MTIDPYILTFSAVTVIATIFMGFWSAKKSKTASDFFVAGRSVSVGWNASAISGEYLSAASFMGVAGMVMSSGYDALWYPVCYACGYLFLLLFIAGPLRRFGAYTIPDFAEGRFDSPLFRKIAVCFVLFIGFFYTMPQMKGAGTTLAYIFPGLPYWAGVVLVGAVITLNVALGGMKGITLVQAFQYWAKMFAISVPIFVLMAVYGHYGKQLGVNGNVQHSTFHAEQKVDSRGFEPDAYPGAFQKEVYRRVFKGSLDKLEAKTAGLGWIRPSDVIRWTPFDTSSAVANYADYRLSLNDWCTNYYEQAILSSRLLKLDTTRLPPSTNLVNAKAFRGYLEALFATNGMTIVEFEKDRIALLMTTNLSKYKLVLSSPSSESGTDSARRLLPEKAPADSTWLSPFGPLTTKAAKAAKPAVSYAGQLIRKESHVSKSGSTDPPEMTVFLPSDEYDIYSFVEDYASFVVHQGKSSFEADLVLSVPASFETTKLRWTNDADHVESKYAERLLVFLQSNGITVVQDGKFEFRAFPTKDAVIKPIDPKPYSLLYTYSLIIALVCGTAGLPHILVRFYTNPDGVAAKRTTMWVMILIGIFYVFPPVFGVMGRNLMPQLYEGVGAKGTDKVVLELPRILNDAGSTGYQPVPSGDSPDGMGRATNATSTASLANRDPSIPVGEVADRNGRVARSTRRIPWGSILSGVTCAGAFAAFMSTFSGLLVSMTGALAHDVYGRMLRPKSTPHQRLLAFKICTVIIGGIAIVLGCFVEPLEINFMVGQAFAIAAASYFPLLFMSVWWRGMTMRGAATGMLTGGLCALAAVTLTNVSNLALDKGPMGKVFAGFAPMNEFWAHHPLLRILCEQPAIWTVPLAIGLMIVVSRSTRKDVPVDVRMKMLVLHAPEKLGLKQEYIQEHQHGH